MNLNHFLSYKLSGDIYNLKAEGIFEDPEEQRVHYELCAKEYQKALKYVKKDIDISLKLIKCYKGAGDMDMALDFALQTITEEGLSGYGEIYKEIGSIYEVRGEYEKARTYYDSYFSLYPRAEDRRAIENRIKRLISGKQSLSGEDLILMKRFNKTKKVILFVFKGFSALCFSYVLAVLGIEFIGYGLFSFIFLILSFSMAFLYFVKPYGITGLMVVNVVLIFTAIFLRFYINYSFNS